MIKKFANTWRKNEVISKKYYLHIKNLYYSYIIMDFAIKYTVIIRFESSIYN